MVNYAMQRKLALGEAVDLSGCARDGEHYILQLPPGESDYCDAKNEKWIWSIGRRHSDGAILASTTNEFYQNPDFDCLWLR